MIWTQKKQLDKHTREQLAQASTDYAACIRTDFWQDFMAGKKVNIETVCLAQKQRVDELQTALGQT